MEYLQLCVTVVSFSTIYSAEMHLLQCFILNAVYSEIFMSSMFCAQIIDLDFVDKFLAYDLVFNYR